MTKLYLLGIRHGPNVDMIDTGRYGLLVNELTREEIHRREEELRAVARGAQITWLNDPSDVEKQAAYGRALREWATWTGHDAARHWANRLIHGFPLAANTTTGESAYRFPGQSPEIGAGQEHR